MAVTVWVRTIPRSAGPATGAAGQGSSVSASGCAFPFCFTKALGIKVLTPNQLSKPASLFYVAHPGRFDRHVCRDVLQRVWFGTLHARS